MSPVDDYLSKQNIVQNKKYHTLLSEKENEFYLKFKLYLDTGLFDKDKNRISITSLFDFYQYFKEDTKIKIVFSFSKMWKMGDSFGFSLSVRRILLQDEIKKAPANKIEFLNDDN